MANATHRYGWKRDDPRRLASHRIFNLAAPADAIYPPVNLRSMFPLAPFDQGNLGSCTANAIDGLRTFDLAKSGAAAAAGSRLFQYYNERVIEDSVSEDSGASIADAVEAWKDYGICNETEWPYVEANFTQTPSSQCYADAKSEMAMVSSRVAQNLQSLYACLAAGFPVIFGISVYDSFESDGAAATGTIPSPDTASEELLGGHAIVLCGIDVAANLAYFRNSWGTSWGDGGYGTLPLKEYLLNSDLASDFWVVKQVGPSLASAIADTMAMRKTAAPSGKTALFVGGFLEEPDDGSPIWDIANQAAALGWNVVKRSWHALAPADLVGGVDVIVDYSWGKAAVWHAMSKAVPAPAIELECTIAGVPCALFGQFDLFGNTYWVEPANVAAAVDFQVDSFPVSRPFQNPSQAYVVVNCDGPGVNHVTIPAQANVQQTILSRLAEVVSSN